MAIETPLTQLNCSDEDDEAFVTISPADKIHAAGGSAGSSCEQHFSSVNAMLVNLCYLHSFIIIYYYLL